GRVPRGPCPNRHLASGKYARVRARTETARHSLARLEDPAQRLVSRLRVILLVLGEVGLPRLLVPDFEEVDRADHHAVPGEIGVATVVRRQRDPALRVRALLVRARRQCPDEGARLRVAARRGRGPAGERGELLFAIYGKAVVLTLGDHQPSRQLVSKLRRQRESPLVIQARRVGPEKHLLVTSLPDHRACMVSPVVRAPHYPTFPHFQSKPRVISLPASAIPQVIPAITDVGGFAHVPAMARGAAASSRKLPANFPRWGAGRWGVVGHAGTAFSPTPRPGCRRTVEEVRSPGVSHAASRRGGAGGAPAWRRRRRPVASREGIRRSSGEHEKATPNPVGSTSPDA